MKILALEILVYKGQEPTPPWLKLTIHWVSLLLRVAALLEFFRSILWNLARREVAAKNSLKDPSSCALLYGCRDIAPISFPSHCLHAHIVERHRRTAKYMFAVRANFMKWSVLKELSSKRSKFHSSSFQCPKPNLGEETLFEVWTYSQKGPIGG